MEVKRVCNKCGEVNSLDSKSLLKKDVYDEDKKHHVILYFECVRCKEVEVVQIDDNESIQTFKEIKALFIKAMRKRLKKETVSPREVKKKDRLTKKLNEKRKLLNEVSKGKTFYDENGKIFIKELTMYTGGDIIESDM
jgi:phage FluMu protein Com